MKSDLVFLTALGGASAARRGVHLSGCSIFKQPVLGQAVCRQKDAELADFLFGDADSGDVPKPKKDLSILDHAFDALTTMQNEFWSHRWGCWPTAIDWTAAFIQTSHSAMTATLSEALIELESDEVREDMVENLIDSHFAESIAFYYGQHDKSIRWQAFDDMLWVVLGWIEATDFIRAHSMFRHLKLFPDLSASSRGIESGLKGQEWYGNKWVQTFANRQAEFWGYASEGWGERLCGGGMNWNPRLTPYKNAITNELWIAANAKLFLDYPMAGLDNNGGGGFFSRFDPYQGRNRTFLDAAVKGYEWLMGSNMTNDKGLFVDGFHVSKLGHNGTVCDDRNEAVYTYNQGVLLTGQRALWDATGVVRFLREGHQLIQSTIAATGWDLHGGQVMAESSSSELESESVWRSGKLPSWRGIGRAGVMEEVCDAPGGCSQNSETFKGIYFHHLAYFCRPLAETLQEVENEGSFTAVKKAHARACTRYLGWVEHNVEAALTTRDSHGLFGQWWGAEKFYGALDESEFDLEEDGEKVSSRGGAVVDYRNDGVPLDAVWTRKETGPFSLPGANAHNNLPRQSQGKEQSAAPPEHGEKQRPTVLRGGIQGSGGQKRLAGGSSIGGSWKVRKDPNKRGRGRTVETQNSGMSLLRCWWELTQAYAPSAEELKKEQQRNRDRWGPLSWLLSKLWLFFAVLR